MKKPSSAVVDARVNSPSADILSAFEARVKQNLEEKSLVHFEGLLTSPLGFALTTASPLQRAIARVADGRPLGDLADDPLGLVASPIAGPAGNIEYLLAATTRDAPRTLPLPIPPDFEALSLAKR